MLDEIQTGIGRTGKWFAYQHEYIIPDVVTLAKALGNGIPIGACLAKGIAAKLLSPGAYGSTFGGNPLACRVAYTVLEIIQAEGLIHRSESLGAYMLKALKSIFSNNSQIKEVRGLGLMIGIELNHSAKELMVEAIRYERLFLNVTRDKTIRLLPCFVSSEATIDSIIKSLSRMIVAPASDQNPQKLSEFSLST